MDIDGCLMLFTAWDSRVFVRVRTNDRRIYCGQVERVDICVGSAALQGHVVLAAATIGTRHLDLAAVQTVAILGSAPRG